MGGGVSVNIADVIGKGHIEEAGSIVSENSDKNTTSPWWPLKPRLLM